jgi:hypothetical protein
MKYRWLRWLLLPLLSPVAILIGLCIGLKQGFKDRKIAFYASGKPVTFGELRRWADTTKPIGEPWEPKTRQ